MRPEASTERHRAPSPRREGSDVPGDAAAGTAQARRGGKLPLVLLLLYVVLVYVRPHEFHPAFQGVPILPVVFALTFVAWLFGGTKRYDMALPSAGAGLIVCIAVGIALSGWPGGAVMLSLDFLPIVLFGWILACTADTASRIRVVMFALMVIGCVLAEHGIDQSVNGVGWSGAVPVEGSRITYLGFMNDPNDLARLFVISLPFALHFARRNAAGWQRLAGIVAVPLLMYGVVLTNSRGAYLAVMVMVAMMAVRRYGLLRGAALGTLPMMVLVALAPSRMSDLSADEESASGRVEAWYAGILMLRENPLFGVGKGAFIDHHELTAHNFFVQAFAELGLVGYFFWFAIVALGFVAIQSSIRSIVVEPGDRARADELHLGRALLGAYVGLLVTSMFLSRAYELTLFLMIGLAFAYRANVAARHPGVASVSLGPNVTRLLKWMIASIIGMYVLTKVLIQIG